LHLASVRDLHFPVAGSLQPAASSYSSRYSPFAFCTNSEGVTPKSFKTSRYLRILIDLLLAAADQNNFPYLSKCSRLAPGKHRLEDHVFGKDSSNILYIIKCFHT